MAEGGRGDRGWQPHRQTRKHACMQQVVPSQLLRQVSVQSPMHTRLGGTEGGGGGGGGELENQVAGTLGGARTA